MQNDNCFIFVVGKKKSRVKRSPQALMMSYLVAVLPTLHDGVDVVVGQPDDPVDGEGLDVDAEHGRVPVLVFPPSRFSIASI